MSSDTGTAGAGREDGPLSDVLGERRWVIAVLVVVALVVLGIVALALRSPGGDDGTDPTSAVVVVPADPGSERAAAVEPLAQTELRMAGRTGSPAPEQTVLVLDEEVLFSVGTTELRESAQAEIDRIVRTIRDSGDGEVDVVGYTDAVAPEDGDLELSRDRAEAFADYLTGLGITNRRLDVDWRGEPDPVAGGGPAPADDAADVGELERRIEVRIDDTGAPAAGGEPVGALGSDEHPTGAVLTVTGVEVQPNAVVVDTELRNLATYPVRLHDDGVWLVDDVGYAYRFMPTWQNPELSVPAGARMSGQLVFPAVAPAEATGFTLVTNTEDPLDAVADPDRDADDATPTFVVTGITR